MGAVRNAVHAGVDDDVGEGSAQFFDRDVLGEVAARPAGHGLRQLIVIGATGEHDDVGARVGGDKAPRGLGPAEVGHRNIEKDERREFGGVPHEGLGTGVSGGDTVDTRHSGDIPAQVVAEAPMIVTDENRRHQRSPVSVISLD